jgi:hypothetical protein
MSARSLDGGASFQSPVPVSDEEGVQWPCPVVGADGTYYIAWVQYWPSSIRIDRSFDGGLTFGTDLTVTTTYEPSLQLNGNVQVFAYPAMDCDLSGGTYHGRLYVAYMDQGGSDYDIYLRYSDDQGVTWSPPGRVNDDPVANGCDQFHPWTCVSGDGAVNIVFYDRRLDPANLLMDVYLAQSLDGGTSFNPNVRLTTVSSDPTTGSTRAGLIGEYIGLAAVTATRVHAVWTDTREGNQDVYTAVGDTTLAALPRESAFTKIQLSPPYPNPADGLRKCTFRAPSSQPLAIRVYDVSGRLVKVLTAQPDVRGSGTFVWDGTDQAGKKVASGTYFACVTDGVTSASTKVLVLD